MTRPEIGARISLRRSAATAWPGSVSISAFADVKRCKLLTREIEAELRFGEGCLGAQEQLFGDDLLVEQTLLALIDRVLEIVVGVAREIFAFGVGDFAAVDDGDDFAFLDAVAQFLAHLGNRAGDLRRHASNAVGIGRHGGRNHDAPR